MKILMTLESFFPPDKRVENEIETLNSAGYKIDIICFGIPGQLKSDTFHGCTVKRIFPSKFILKSSAGALSFPFYFRYWKKVIKDHLMSNNYDVIHIHDLPLIKPISQLRNEFSFKIVLDLHENWPGLLNNSPHTKTILGRILCNINDWKEYEKTFLNQADKIIVVINEAKSRIQKFYNSPENIYIVSNTINLNGLTTPIKLNNNVKKQKVMVYEGGLTYHRGLQNIIHALSLLDKRLLPEFRIIGSGKYIGRLRQLVNELDLNEYINFYGQVSQDEVYNLLSTSDIAIIPHLKSEHTDNTIPHKLFHYIYAGLPVIASDCSPIERIIKETGSGVIYKDNNLDSLTRILTEALSDDSFCAKYSRSRKWISEKYNWSNDSNNLKSLYRSINNDN